jgi:hypothetical protein
VAAPAETVHRSPLTGRWLRTGVARSTRAGLRPQAIDRIPLTRRERRELAEIESELRADGTLAKRPRTLAECPPEGEPCPWTSCRLHLATTMRGRSLVVTFPDRELAEMPETCAMRVARRQQAKREMLSDEAIGDLLNLTAERVRQETVRALRKVRAALESG